MHELQNVLVENHKVNPTLLPIEKNGYIYHTICYIHGYNLQATE